MKKRNVLIIIASLAALGMTAGCVPEGTDNTSSFEKSADIEANNNETDNNETDNNGTDNGVTDSSEKDNEDEVSTVKVETEETEKTEDTAETEEMEEATEIFETEIKNSLKARKRDLVENVSFERKNDNEYEFAVINGLDKENNIVWSYETEKYMMAQLDSTEEIGIYKNRYYFVADGTVIALNLEDGSLLWKNDEFDGAGIDYGFGDDGTLYLCGYFGPDFYAVDKEGRTLKRIDSFDQDYYWPYKIEVSDNYVDVTMEASPTDDESAFRVYRSDYAYRNKEATIQ